MLILAGVLLGALLMQWRWSCVCLQPLVMRRRLPREAFAGVPFRVRFLASNRARSMPIWMIRVDDKIRSPSYGVSSSHASIGRVGPGRTVAVSQDAVISRRGRYDFGPLKVSTRFPFALFESSAQFAENETLYVYPPLLRLQSQWKRRLSSQTGGMSTTARRNGLNEGEFFGLREWHNGDSPRWIHWRTTARLNEPAVRQFEQHRRFDVVLVFDAYGTGVSDSVVEGAAESLENWDRTHADFESAVSLAASLLVAMSSSIGNRVGLIVAGQTASAVVENVGTDATGRMLRPLAEVLPTLEPDLGQAITLTGGHTGRKRDIVVVSPRSRDHAFLSDPGLITQLAPWIRRGSLQWIDASSELDRWVQRNRGEIRTTSSAAVGAAV